MLLPQQIQAILYHLLMGWVYALGFSFFISFVRYLRFPILKGIVEILYHVLFTSLMFYGLYRINGGITNLYLLGFFITGVGIFYSLYLPVVMQYIYAITCRLSPIRKKLVLVKHKMFVIIRLPVKRMKRRKANAKEKKRKRKAKKKKTSAENLF